MPCLVGSNYCWGTNFFNLICSFFVCHVEFWKVFPLNFIQFWKFFSPKCCHLKIYKGKFPGKKVAEILLHLCVNDKDPLLNKDYKINDLNWTSFFSVENKNLKIYSRVFFSPVSTQKAPQGLNMVNPLKKNTTIIPTFQFNFNQLSLEHPKYSL